MVRLVILKPEKQLDEYHVRRMRKHGAVYIVTGSFGRTPLLETKSVATGAFCTLDSTQCEEVADHAM